jgi:hypothetical protein
MLTYHFSDKKERLLYASRHSPRLQLKSFVISGVHLHPRRIKSLLCHLLRPHNQLGSIEYSQGVTAMTQSTNQPGAADLSKRTPEEIFAHHGQALGAEDLDATVMDFADTAVIVTPDGVRRGKDAIRNFFDGLFKALPKAQWGLKTIYVDNVLFLEWTGDSARASVSDGVDTFLFKDGLIQAQTVHCTIVPKT